MDLGSEFSLPTGHFEYPGGPVVMDLRRAGPGHRTARAQAPRGSPPRPGDTSDVPSVHWRCTRSFVPSTHKAAPSRFETFPPGSDRSIRGKMHESVALPLRHNDGHMIVVASLWEWR